MLLSSAKNGAKEFSGGSFSAFTTSASLVVLRRETVANYPISLSQRFKTTSREYLDKNVAIMFFSDSELPIPQ